MDRNELCKFGEVKETKHYIQVFDPSLKKALVMKRCVHLEDSSKNYGEDMKIFTPEEIKKRHMGKIKCIVKYRTDDELKSILQAYFS